jgi:LacI family transcriptional regulator
MMNGVARFVQEHEPWCIYLKPTTAERSLRRWIDQWDGDGIITTILEEDEQSLADIKIPLVDLLGQFPERGFPIVRTNDRVVGQLGAQHLLERGLRHFGFCEFSDHFWSVRRREGFEQRLRSEGFSCQVHSSTPHNKGWTGPETWEQHERDLIQWIDRLPKPAGVMTSTDLLGQQFLEACLRAQVSVPDTIAVIGVDNDEPICRIASPPLSSVIIDDQRRGYEAAMLLSRLMAGEPKPDRPTFVDPVGVQARASSDVYAIDDDLLVKALRFLRENATTSVGVTDVAHELHVSRSLIERKFRRLLGRSINDEIIRLRVNLAIQLISETKLELTSIAVRCGFSSQAYMTSVFKTRIGRTPGSYRR